MDLELENSKDVLARLVLALSSQDANRGLRGSFPNNREKDGRHDECYHKLTLDMDEYGRGL